jgi:hypothetical protein
LDWIIAHFKYIAYAHKKQENDSIYQKRASDLDLGYTKVAFLHFGAKDTKIEQTHKQ